MGNGPSRKLISIVIPAFNEEDNVGPLYQAVLPVMNGLKDRYDFEMIFTDNHSTDGTFGRLSALARHDGRIRIFRFSRNFGYQRSIYTGYMKARGDAVVQLDCDLQDPPSMIADFLKLWEQGSQVVFGIRRTREEGWLIQWVRRVFYRVAKILSEDDLPLDAGDFRLLDRKIVNILRDMDDSQPYLRGAVAAMGFNQTGIPYDRKGRERGTSKFSISHLFGLALDGILNHSVAPLRLATFTGITVSVLTMAAIVVYAFGKVVLRYDWPPGFATTTVLILFSLSLNALFLGIIGEYLGRIYKQVKKKPLTIIEDSIDGAESVSSGNRNP